MKADKQARVVLYTDEPITGAGFLVTLGTTQDLVPEVITGDNTSVVSQLEGRKPDLLLLDMCANIDYGMLAELRQRFPDCHLILWARAIAHELACQAMSLGVRGVLRKNLTEDLFLKCLRKVRDGEVWFEKGLTSAFFTKPMQHLSKREGQLVRLLAKGLKNKEIANELGLSEGTVKVYLSRLFEKLGVKDRFELALYGLRNLSSGSLSLDPGEGTAQDRKDQDVRILMLG